MANVELLGQRFTRWTVVRKTDKRCTNKVLWECLCDCGNTGLVTTGNLNFGLSKSCGCYDRELASKRLLVHGDAAQGVVSVENSTHAHMVSRCTNPKNKQYHDYGGRGISVCEEWRGKLGYVNFLAHVGRRPSNKHSIDRIDVNGNYEPGNVRWATRDVQAHNKRISKKNKSGISGVYLTNNSWLAKITDNYKQIRLLRTDDFFEACCARKSAELKYWGI